MANMLGEDSVLTTTILANPERCPKVQKTVQPTVGAYLSRNDPDQKKTTRVVSSHYPVCRYQLHHRYFGAYPRLL